MNTATQQEQQAATGVTADAPGNPADRAVKRRRVLDILDAAGRDSLLLSTNTALTWYLDGSRVHISLAGDPIAAMLVDRDGDQLVTFNNEAARIAAEELPDGVALHTVPWHGHLHAAAAMLAPGGNPLAEADVTTELRAARQQFLPGESARYARLCADAAAAMTDVLSGATPQTTEFEVASALAARIVAMGAEPLVLLCNGDGRSGFRHPLPTHAPLGRRAMAVVCARRNGLVANVTRWVRFDAGTPAERDAEARIAAVEADIFDATVPGARLDGIFAEIKKAYAPARLRGRPMDPAPPGRSGRLRGPGPPHHAFHRRCSSPQPDVHLEPVGPGREDRGHGAADRVRDHGPQCGPPLANRCGERPAASRDPAALTPRSTSPACVSAHFPALTHAAMLIPKVRRNTASLI